MSKPKISLNKLGEYLDATTPARRRQIIKDQQNPQAFKAARYQDARNEIVNFIQNDMLDDAGLLEAAQQLRDDASASSEYVLQDKRASADAIENFLDAADNINLEGVVAEPIDNNHSSTMEISGVNVSIRPDLILKDESTGSIKGAIKLHFSKTHPLTDKAAGYVAAAVKVYLSEHCGNSEVEHSKCYVVDIPTQKVISATRTHKNKMRDIEAACEEIDARWNKDDK